VTLPASPPTSVVRAVQATKRRDALLQGARALWLPLMVLAGYGAFGALIILLPNAIVSLFAGIVLVATAWLFFKAIKHFDPINDRQAQGRLEAQAGLTELAPLTMADDRPLGGDPALWAWQEAKRAEAATRLTKPVNPPVSRQDGLRALALLLAAGICLWQPVAAARALTFDLSPLVGDRDFVLDAWAQPPDYTGLPVVRLSRDLPEVALPEGSVIHARLDGAVGAPHLRVGRDTIKMVRDRGQAWQAKATLRHAGDIVIDRLGARARWHVRLVKDRPPILQADEPIKTDSKGRLDVVFTAKDDYGIAGAALRITALDPPASLGSKTSFETPLIIDGEAGEDGSRRLFVDVGDHVLTGMPVSIAVVVRDGKGQQSVGPETQLILPQVRWKSTLAQALQEQRLLILREQRAYQPRPPVMATLFEGQSGLPIKLDLTEPLIGAPEGIARAEHLLRATLASLRQTGASDVAIMALHLARERVVLARTTADAHGVAPLLWQMALQAEAGDQTPAQQRLAAAKQALEQALKNGASDEEIARLTQELREAVGERLNELAQQGGGSGGSGGQDGESISAGDIDKMLRDLEQSGGSGARQDALDQLDQLGELMDNLQAGGGGQGGQAGGSGRGQGGPNPLDDAMREQRDLSDETGQRQSQNQGAPASDLADRQAGLADRLSPEGDEGESPGGRPPQSAQSEVDGHKRQAASAMREAAQALRRGDLSGAQDAQARAEQALQQAASAQSAASGQAGGDKDPLGRSLPGIDDGRATKVPDQVEKRRARDVREELRRRQADPNRDGQERDYLDRLLKDR
jgi:hypothetical protein